MATMTAPGRLPDVGDVVTRGRSKLRWVVESVRIDEKALFGTGWAA